MKRSILAFILCVILSASLAIILSADETENSFDSAKAGVHTESPLYGKRILFVGDSICNAQCENNNDKNYPAYGWAGRIGNEYNMTWVNKGVSGASISTVRGSKTVLAQLKNAGVIGATYDIVLLHGGVNDGWDNARVGTMTALDNFDPDSFDQSTFAGGLEYTIWYTKKHFTKAEIGYIINAKTPSYLGSLNNMTKYWNVAKEICDKWDIPYLDLYSIPEINSETVPTCNNDKIHPTHVGYDFITPYIAAFAEEVISGGEVAPDTTADTATPTPVTTEQTDETPSVTDVAGETATPTPVITEQTDEAPSVTDVAGETVTPDETVDSSETTAPDNIQTEKKDDTVLYVVIGMIAVAGIVTAVIFLKSRKKKG